MADLYFPQLRSGALAHFPLRKTLKTRTITNASPDGSLTMLPDDGATRWIWDWKYTGLSSIDVNTLQTFFESCYGPLKPFTFLAPTGNLLSNSSNFASESWQKSGLLKSDLQLSRVLPDTTSALITNVGQGAQELSQTCTIPGSYQYCFSLYVSSQTPQTITLFRRGRSSEEFLTAAVGPTWKRVWTQGRLEDDADTFSIGVTLAAGQQVSISAAQLEPQHAPSPYRSTLQSGDVYQNAHWAVGELPISCEGPNTFSVSVSVETAR